MSPMFDLAGKLAVVTGAGSGLGEAIAAGLAERGASVVVADLDGDAARRVAQAIAQLGGTARPCQLDVSRYDDVQGCFAELDVQGGVDILVASAGIGLRRPALEMTPADWQRVLHVNLTGLWYCNQAAGRSMVGRGGGGSIVNIGSVVGQVGIDTGNANYAASKGGVIGLTKCLAIEWAPHRVRVNVVAPTHFRTPLVEKAIEANPSFGDRFASNIPLGRLGEPREIVGAVVFLASDDAAMVTGHVLNVDGGHTAR
jgi:NAD(P)-dependent dehydrogenase (short-subunit alcohol dehydrogenase family)